MGCPRAGWTAVAGELVSFDELVMEAAGLSLLVKPVSSTTSAFTGKLAANHRATLRYTPA